MSLECAACDEKFGGLRAFDSHLVGRFDVDPPDRRARRCRTPEEMLAAGLVQDDKGIWRREGPVARARRHWRSVAGFESPSSVPRPAAKGRLGSGRSHSPEKPSNAEIGGPRS